MDTSLSIEQEQILDLGRDLADRFDRDYWRRQIEERRFPEELWRELGKGGYLGMLVPEACGGAGLGLFELALLTEGLAAAGFPLLTMITGPGLALPALARAGGDALRGELLPSLLTGESVLPFAITEGAVGSDLLSLATRIDPVGDVFHVSGVKDFTSLGDVAGHVLVLGRTRDERAGRDGFTLAVVPTNARGFHRVEATTRLPMPERQCTLTFERVEIGAERIVGLPGRALEVLAPALVWERVLSAALSVGLGSFALSRAVGWVRERVVGGKPLGVHQAVQHPLSVARIRLEGARLLMRDTACRADRGEAVHGDANMAVWAAGEAGFAAADAALQVHGGHGYTRDADILAIQQMTRLLRSAPVHAESALNAVGETVLGLPRSS